MFKFVFSKRHSDVYYEGKLSHQLKSAHKVEMKVQMDENTLNYYELTTYSSEVSAGGFPVVSLSTATCNIPFSVSQGYMMEG